MISDHPPRLADRFFRWFCKRRLREELLGDLHELYALEVKYNPRWKARLIYWQQVFLFLRPFALKRHQIKATIMFRNQLKLAWRNILKHRGSAALNVLSLSVGISCFIFIFVFLHGEWSYDRFHDEADLIRRVVIDFVDEKGERIPDATTPPALAPALVRDFPEVISSVRLFPNWGSTFVFRKDDQKYIEEEVLRVDSTFFDIFTFSMLHGDPHTALIDPNSLVITKSTSVKYFGVENSVGQTLTLIRDSPVSLKVTGVLEDLPETSHFQFRFLLRIPFENIDTRWGWYNYYTYIKLGPNADMVDFEEKLQPFFEGYQEPSDTYNAIYSQALSDIHLDSNLKWELANNGDRKTVKVLAALAVFVMLLSCLNSVNLTVGEMLRRVKDVGLRKTLGESKSSIIMQFVMESLIIGVIALLVAGLLAELYLVQLRDLLGRSVTLLDKENLMAIVWIVMVVLILSLGSALFPAFYLGGFGIVDSLKGTFNAASGSISRLHSGLLVVQFAISSLMILGALTVRKQFNHLNEMDKGLKTDNVLVIENGSEVQSQEVFNQELSNVPGVASSSLSSGIIGDLNWTTRLGYPNEFLMNYLIIDTSFIETVGLELVAGRNFSSHRSQDTIGWTLMVNKKGLHDLGLSLEDVGRSVPIIRNDSTIENGTIIGVVEDFHFTDFKSEIKPFAFFYRSFSRDFIHVRLREELSNDLLATIEAKWSTFSNGSPMQFTLFDRVFDRLSAQEDKLSKILSYLTILALFISLVGMFAIARLKINRKTKEIAVRRVLGGRIFQISGGLARHFLILVVLANVLAIPPAYWYAKNWLDSFAYHTSLGSGTIFITILITILFSGALVGWQAWKVVTRNPVLSLRSE